MKTTIKISNTKMFFKYFLAIFGFLTVYLIIYYKTLELIVAILIGAGIKTLGLISAILIYVFSLMLGISMGTLTFILIIGTKIILNKEGLFIYTIKDKDENDYILYKSILWEKILPKKVKKVSEETKEKIKNAFDKTISALKKNKEVEIVQE